MTATPPALADQPGSEAAFARTGRLVSWWRGFGRPPRIMGLDVARALAVLGMVGAHVGTTADEVRLFEPDTWSALVHGRSSILFAVLAGISIALMTGRTRRPDRDELPALRLNLIGRGAVVFMIGLVLELMGTPVAVILTVYGLLYVIAIPFLRWRPGALLIAAAALALAGPAVLAVVRALSLGASGMGADLVLFGTYPATVWTAFMLAGMGLGRLRLQRARTAAVVLAAGVVLAAAGYGLGAFGAALADAAGAVAGDSSAIESGATADVGVPAAEVDLSDAVCDDWGAGEYYCYPEVPEQPAETSDSGGEEFTGGVGWSDYPRALEEQMPFESVLSAIFWAEPHSGGTAEIVGSGGFAIAVIGVCLLLSRPLRWVLLPLAALGSMPLTAYSGHIVAILVLAGPGALPGGEHDWGWFALVLVVAATAWSILFGQGPLERLVGRAAAAMSSAPARHDALRLRS